MRDLRLLDGIRDIELELRWTGTLGGSREGCFKATSDTDGGMLCIIASGSAGWDHVSVSRTDRTPIWDEMEQVKRLFFKDTETAMQVHVPPTEHINNHPHCLHLWRPHGQPIPRPPAYMVGIEGKTPEDVKAMSDDEIMAARS